MASDYLLELDGVKGESKDERHPGTIELLSWSLGASNPTRRLRGKVVFQDFHFRAYSSSASEQLLLRLNQNTTYMKHATLWGTEFDETGQQVDTWIFKMTDCLVSSFAVGINEDGFEGASGGLGAPTPQSVDVVAMRVGGWDLKKNTKV